MLKPFSTEWNCLLRKLDRLTGSKQSAEDALQDTFLKVNDYRFADLQNTQPLPSYTTLESAPRWTCPTTSSCCSPGPTSPRSWG